MQENEFEKQVRQKMDDLKLHPSDAVWQKIEPQIKKEKRRRWLLILLPVILIGFLYGGYVFLNNDKPYTQPQQHLTKNSIEKDNSATQPVTISDPIKNNYPAKATEIPILKAGNVKTVKKENMKIPAKLNDSDVATSLTRNIIAAKIERKENMKEKINIGIQNPELEKIINKESNSVNTITQLEESPKQTEVLPAKDTIETKNENIVKKDNLATGETKKITKSKFSRNLGFTFSGGVSSMTNNFFGYGGQTLYAVQSYSGAVTGSPGTGPSLIKPSVTFVIGVVSEKNVSKKIIVSSGINYKLLSTTNTVGSDSAGFYSTSNINPYHNYYHYIELPVGLKFQLADFKKGKLYWNAGLSISQLIGAKALQYNISSGLYYHDNAQFNKTQIGLNTGFDLSLSSKQERSFIIGPYLNYGLSKIASQGYNKHHFTFIGLRAQYLFRKK